MTHAEKQFENRIKAFLKNYDAWFLKTWSNGIQREGVPDILACVNGYFIGIEVKAKTGHPSDLQLKNVRDIRESGGIAFILYPDQFDDFVKLIDAIDICDQKTDWWEQTAFDERLTEREKEILYGNT